MTLKYRNPLSTVTNLPNVSSSISKKSRVFIQYKVDPQNNSPSTIPKELNNFKKSLEASNIPYNISENIDNTVELIFDQEDGENTFVIAAGYTSCGKTTVLLRKGPHAGCLDVFSKKFQDYEIKIQCMEVTFEKASRSLNFHIRRRKSSNYLLIVPHRKSSTSLTTKIFSHILSRSFLDSFLILVSNAMKGSSATEFQMIQNFRYRYCIIYQFSGLHFVDEDAIR